MSSEMSESYHKARRQFGFFSSLLLAWEFVGIKPVGEAITFKFMSNDNAFTINHPEVIPIVILILVIYFGIRYAIEWSQCDSERRLLRASKIDFYLAYIIGFASILVFGSQELLADFSLANVLTQLAAAIAVCGAVVSGLIFLLTMTVLGFKKDKLIPGIISTVAISVIATLVIDMVTQESVVIPAISGALLGIAGVLAYAYYR